MKILIVEDEQNIAQGIASILRSQTHYATRLMFAESGRDALDLLQNQPLPDLIITDIRMVNMTGIEFVESLRENNSSTKVIIISGYDHFEYAQRALRAGVMDYLLKPIDKKQLLTLVDKVWQELPEIYSADPGTTQVSHEFFSLDFKQEGHPASLIKIIDFIRKNYTNDISLQMISEDLMLHPNYISSLINKHFKVSFPHILDYVRLEKACELLYSADRTIAEISYLAGYKNERRLYAAFRKYLGSSPGDFRRSINQEY